jgi:hypothetical protein
MAETNADTGPGEPRKLTDDDRRRLRQEQNNRARRAQVDMRFRVAKRQRQIERGLRASLIGQGRVITIHDDCLIGSLANCLIQQEIMTGERSRGAHVDTEELTRLANAAQRLVGALGLKPEIAQEPAPRLHEYLDRRGDGGDAA